MLQNQYLNRLMDVPPFAQREAYGELRLVRLCAYRSVNTPSA